MSFDPKQINHWPTIAKCWLTGAILLAAVAAACAQEPTKDSHEISIDAVLTGIAAVETGTNRVSTGTIIGRWGYGEAGEVGPFQMHPSVLRDLGVADQSRRIHRDPVLAESYARLWLIRLHNRFGNWPDSVAAWNAGAAGFHGRSARDYSQRVMNIAGSIN